MNGTVPAQRNRRQLLVAFLVPLLFLVPFANKAFHMDDTFYLWVAEKIHETPLDYYGFTISWGLLHAPAHEVNKNPPGASYYLALAALVGGWREIPLHIATALLAAALSAAICLLARRVCALPLHATLIAVITPVFLVSSNTVMSDVPMYALYVWAVYLWITGLERNNHPLLLAAAILMGLSALTKYFGLTTVPLLVVYTLMKARLTPRLLYFLVPIAIVAAYQFHSYRLYGINLLGDAAGFAVGLGWTEDRFPIWAKSIAGIAFTGGCIASLLFYAPCLWSRRILIATLFAFPIITLTLLLLANNPYFPGVIPNGPILSYAAQYALFILAGLQIIAIALLEFRRRPNAETTLLVLWFFGTLVFATYVNWTINARVILPMLVPAVLLAARRLEFRLPAERWTAVRTHALPLTAAAALALAVMWGDYRHANSAREAANVFTATAREYPHPYFYKGHWGFQYYMDRGGIEAFNPQGLQLAEGTRIVVPTNNNVFGRLNPAVARAYRDISLTLPASRWVVTMRRAAGAGFYTHFAGAIPYVFGPAPLEEYAVYQLADYEGLAAAGQDVPIEFYDRPPTR